MLLCGNFVIKGDWEDSPTPDDKIEIIMPPVPNGIFGAGWHVATQFALSVLPKNLQKGMSFLDFGAGTGIIAVAAAKLGASKIYIAELDDAAIAFADRLLIANDVDAELLTNESPTVDLCISTVGTKILELCDRINARIILGLDAQGGCITFTSVYKEDGERKGFTVAHDYSEVVKEKKFQFSLLRPDGVDLTPLEGATQILAFKLDMTPDAVVGCEQDGIVHLSLSKSLMNYRASEFQSAMDIQFGPGKVIVET